MREREREKREGKGESIEVPVGQKDSLNKYKSSPVQSRPCTKIARAELKPVCCLSSPLLLFSSSHHTRSHSILPTKRPLQLRFAQFLPYLHFSALSSAATRPCIYSCMVITGNNKAQHSKLSKLASPNYQQLQLDASHRGALSREEAESAICCCIPHPEAKRDGPLHSTSPIPSHPIPSQPSPASCSPSRTECRCLAGFSRKKVKARIQGRHFSGVWPLSFLPQPPNKHEAFIPHRGHSCLLNRVCRCLEQRRSVNYVHYPLFEQWPLDSLLPNPPRTCQ